MNRWFSEIGTDPKMMNALTLAFVGDAVFENMVRERLVCSAEKKVNELHQMSVKSVCASAQASHIEKLMPVLSDREIAVYKRGRNIQPGHIPKNASVRDYHMSTGFEALIGYLYLSNELDRIKELFEIIWTD